MRSPSGILTSILLTIIASSPKNAMSQDFLRLRDGTTMTGITVESVDINGVHLANDARISWGKIQSGGVSADHRERFDQYLKELSEPLYLIGQRLRVRDDEALPKPVEQIKKYFENQNGPAAFLFHTANFWSLVANGRREEAVLPLLVCYTLLSSDTDIGADIPDGREIQFDLNTGFSTDLIPIWHDRKSAETVLPVLSEMLSKLKSVPESAYIMYSTLALTARMQEEADRILQQLAPTQVVSKNMFQIARIQRSYLTGDESSQQLINSIEPTINAMDNLSQPAAHYWSGLVLLRSTNDIDHQRAMVHLITITGKYGRKYPQLAASSLYSIYNLLADQRDSFVVGLSKAEREASRAAIKHEITSRYRGTTIAKRFTVVSDADRTEQNTTENE